MISPADYARVRAASIPHRWRSFLPEEQRETQSAQGEKSNSDEEGQEHQREICPLLPRPYRRRLWIGYFQLTPAYPVVSADHHRREPRRPFDSGNRDGIRMPNERRSGDSTLASLYGRLAVLRYCCHVRHSVIDPGVSVFMRNLPEHRPTVSNSLRLR